MHEATKYGKKFAVVKNGELIEKGFNYLSEAQERADELNEKG